MEIWKYGNQEIWKYGKVEIWKFGNLEVQKYGNKEMRNKNVANVTESSSQLGIFKLWMYFFNMEFGKSLTRKKNLLIKDKNLTYEIFYISL